MNQLEEMGRRAKEAAHALAVSASRQRDETLQAIAHALCEETSALLKANEADMRAAADAGMAVSMQDRLRLTEQRIREIAQAVREITMLPDPLGRVLDGNERPNGLRLTRVTTPLGVVGMIYEARPNVTVDAAALCLKSGNACILRGGKEAIHSNTALARVMRAAVEKAGLPADAIQLVEDTGRESAAAMMNLTGYLDVLIPRGGKGLIRSVVENARVPVIETGAGNCHIFVDASAPVGMAVDVCDNAKTSRPSVCNAVETVLIHRDIAPVFLPALQERLRAHQVELRGCPRTASLLPGITLATEQDYATEYDDYILALRVVDSLDEAIAHIRTYTTGHSEAILTNDYENAQKFTAQIDAAAVYVNASTRFTDGGEFGFGAEIGISTQKLHVRGPMGLSALCSSKYIISGNGQIR